MDPQTLAAYDTHAKAFADDWHEQPAPADLHALVRRYFNAGRTADIGCGSGREVAWLSANGYPAVGYDPSEGLLAQARERYPRLQFECAALPELAGLAAGSFDNVLCETVIMHLAAESIPPSVERLLSLLRRGGVLYISWRITRGSHQRDAHARLYAAFDRGTVIEALSGATILLDEEVTSVSSGKTIHRIVARRRGND
jgi:SAM-dependent methyltransferase